LRGGRGRQDKKHTRNLTKSAKITGKERGKKSESIAREGKEERGAEGEIATDTVYVQ